METDDTPRASRGGPKKDLDHERACKASLPWIGSRLETMESEAKMKICAVRRNDAAMGTAGTLEGKRVATKRCCPRDTDFLDARRSPASGWCARKDTCQEGCRGSIIRVCRRRSTVDRAFLASNMHLRVDHEVLRSPLKRETGPTEVPLLRSFSCLHVDGICLLDHVLASPPWTHRRCTDGIFLVAAR